MYNICEVCIVHACNLNVLGEQFMYSHGFLKQTVYDETVNPGTTLEHSTGAFRILHKQIPPILK